MRTRNYRYFVGDFETTVYDGQEYTEVWASACVELESEVVRIFGSIGAQYNYFKSLHDNIVVYYHNLKFDGNFWLSYFKTVLGYKESAVQPDPNDINTFEFNAPKDMDNGTIIYSISNMGQWYRIIVKENGKLIEFRDSLKLLPFSVERMGKAFKTKHQKLNMEYKGYRYADCPISDEEKRYIANDVLVVKECIELMFKEGHKKLTIGSCCLSEYKQTIGDKNYKRLFPNVYEEEIDEHEHSYKTVGDWVKQAYHGAWCYVAKGKEKKVYSKGITVDVNSLYPSVMHSSSRNRYPVGHPTFWSGDYIPEQAKQQWAYYFVRVRTRFYLKPGKLPFIQIKNNMLYKGTECLESSDIYNYNDGKYYPAYRTPSGEIKQAIVEMTLTMTDYARIKEHYELTDFNIIDGCYFRSAIGIFDEYIDKWMKIKANSKGAVREQAKLFLTNLYGKMASSTCSSFKVAKINPDKSLGYYTVIAFDKIPGYIPVGAAITSYARDFTIRAAQKNYHGPDKPGFIYADTDSIHCDLPPEELIDIPVHPTALSHWKLESYWDYGFFVRQKTYVEHVTHSDGEPVEPYYNIKCAGMPERCKQIFLLSTKDKSEYSAQEKEIYDKLDESQKEFVSHRNSIEDFNIGLIVPGKLLPKRIPGGVVLKDTVFEMRPN